MNNDPRSVFFQATNTPCPCCHKLYHDGRIDREMVMPLPAGAMAPLGRRTNEKVCFDCAAAEGTMDAGYNHPEFGSARLVIGNERVEGLRMPEGMMQHFGLRSMGFNGIRLCSINDLQGHFAWLDDNVPDIRCPVQQEA